MYTARAGKQTRYRGGKKLRKERETEKTTGMGIVHEANNYLYLNNTVACSLITNEIVIFNDSAVMVVCLVCRCRCFI